MKLFKSYLLILLMVLFHITSHATLIELSDCIGANACTITTTPPNPVVQDPNDGILWAWDEVQNFTLTEALRVDRVFDESASFVTAIAGGGYWLAAGTIVSSHYLQWDPGEGSSSTVSATIKLDSQVFAFMTDDSNLFASDEFLGLPGMNYSDFVYRGLEVEDTTNFNGTDVDINWTASTPGDWTRLITAYSPAAVNIPEPEMFGLFLLFLLLNQQIKRKKR